MAEPFIGEIRVFGAGVVPRGWMPCVGQTLPISQNQALFALLGTQFGGNGSSTFMLPDLRGRVPIGVSSSYLAGAVGGEAAHTLTVQEMPAHTHQVTACSTGATQAIMANNFWASTMSYDDGPDATMAPGAIGTSGSGAPHNNMQPYLALNFCVAIAGIFPSRP
jgi:microcystin-dependent protein